ncbi:MAG: hypothetical protein KDK66_02830 [Deltaproteobacteria bacterium]|nr:hypothetical protein [Deltaproteobacteria bacterium]
MILRFLFLLSLLWVFPAQVFAQASPNVSVLDTVYQDLDALVALGLIKDRVVGQRPYSEREIVWMAKQAEKNLLLNLSQAQQDFSVEKRLKRSQRLINKIKRRFSTLWNESPQDLTKVEIKPISQLSLGFLKLDASPRGFGDNGLGLLEASLNPLIAYREGRHLVNGSNLAMELQHGFRLSPYFYLQAQERMQLALAEDGSQENKVFIHQLSGKFLIKNLEVQVGRDAILWGQGEDGGLLLSANARPLDAIQLSNDLPFRLPWVFKVLGPAKFSFFFADLGPEQHFPHSKLVGTKLSFQPYSFFEFGLSNMTLFGGEGAPSAGLGTRLTDIFPLVQFLTGAQAQVDNKMGGFDFRFHFKRLRGSELYLEAIFDDTPGKDQKKFWIEDAGHVLGVWLPRLTDDGRLSLRLEYRRTGIRYYRHPQFQSGWSLNQNILGDDLGPDAQGFYFKVYYELRPEHRLALHGAWESRSEDRYIGGVSDGGLSFSKVEDRVEETRLRLGAYWNFEPEEIPLRLKLEGAYERVQNFAFVSGETQHHWLAALSLDVFFKSFYTSP